MNPSQKSRQSGADAAAAAVSVHGCGGSGRVDRRDGEGHDCAQHDAKVCHLLVFYCEIVGAGAIPSLPGGCGTHLVFGAFLLLSNFLCLWFDSVRNSGNSRNLTERVERARTQEQELAPTTLNVRNVNFVIKIKLK